MIIEFSNPDQMKQWREVCAPVEKYLAYVTSEKEVILRPTKSTNTLDYGYYEAITKEKLDDILKSLTEAQYIILHVRAVHWDKERFDNATN